MLEEGSCHTCSVYKKGGFSSPKNYWPIALTSTVVGKILESFIRDDILDHLIRHSLSSLYNVGLLLERCIYHS